MVQNSPLSSLPTGEQHSQWDDKFIDSLFLPVFEVREDGAILYINAAGRQLLGIGADESLPPFAVDLLHPEDRKRFLEELWSAGKRASRRNEYRLTPTDGSIIHVSGSMAPCRTDKELVVQRGFFVDISPMVEAEQQLRTSDERYALVSRGANDGIWDWDILTDKVYFSPRYKEIIGYAEHEFANHADEWRRRIHPDDLDMVVEANMRCIRGETDQFEVEFRMLHRDGNWKWILGRGAGLSDETGKVIRLAGTHTDISRSKNAEAALRASEELHSALSRASFEAVLIIENGVIVAANEATRRLFGHSLSELSGKAPASLMTPDSQNLVRVHLQKDSGEAVETTGQKIDGDTFHAELRSRSFRYQGRQTQVLSIRDISRRKQAEERYRTIFENALEGIYQSTPDGRFITANSTLATMLGYESPAQLMEEVTDIGKQIYINRSERERFVRELALHGQVRDFETQVRKRDGSLVWISQSVRAEKNQSGRFLHYEGFAQDITTRKTNELISAALYRISRAVSATADLTELYQTIHQVLREAISANNFYIARVYPDENRLTFSHFQDERDHMYDLFDISNPETRGLTLDVIREGRSLFLKRDQLEHEMAEGRRVVRGTMPAVWIGVPLIMRDKTIGAMAVQDYENQNQFTDRDVLFLESVSDQIALAIERKSNEERIIRLNETLESKVVQRTAELERKASELEAANLRLRELDQLKSSLISSISHELRTPLTSIRGFAKLVARDISRKLCPMFEESSVEQLTDRMIGNLSIIESEGERLTRLINDFLDLSRIESGKTFWNDMEFDPSSILRETGRSIGGQLAGRPVQLEVNVPETLPCVVMDEDRLRQVMINLLNNAAKFTDQGRIGVQAGETDENLFICVEDTGIGIAPEHHRQVFDRFHKAGDGDTVPGRGGTGLGLSICKEIVEHYGGEVRLESQPGCGSRFTVFLPKKEDVSHKETL
jgi:PAS domain S-box-containing protein